MIWPGIAIAIASAAGGLLPAMPAGAQHPPPGNSVSCAYDAMTAEDREIALLLMAREFGQGGAFVATSPNLTAIHELIEAAQRTCGTRFRWSAFRAEVAGSYALTALLGEAIAQSLQAAGHSIAPLDGYYREHGAALRRDGRFAGDERLAQYLGQHGWDDATEFAVALAALYLETLIEKDEARRQFGSR